MIGVSLTNKAWDYLTDKYLQQLKLALNLANLFTPNIWTETAEPTVYIRSMVNKCVVCNQFMNIV